MTTPVTKENLPPTPTHQDNLSNSLPQPPPSPPPKSLSPLHDTPSQQNALPPLPVDSPTSIQESNDYPSTPTSPPSPDARGKRPNLLVDLIETEKLFVDQMAGVIRKVASAWSRTNLPPHELDLMFRSIESVYKADRSLLSRLKEIGTNPSSPKALGDLLMRWIGDLEPPYTTYCERYCSGFDAWEPVCNNARLPDVLAAFSATLPPPNTSSTNPDPPVWTLDELFLLPKGRLKYFKKLYGRLLKGAQPGRSDYKLLAGAAGILDKLLGILDARANLKAGSSTPTAPETEDEVVVDFRNKAVDAEKLLEPQPTETPTGSETSSARESSQSSAARSSNDTSQSSIEQGATGDLGISLLELEGHLSAERCLDIFTMKPRQVRLQILPPTLPYARTMKIGVGVDIRFVPRSTGVEVNHPSGRIFILSDLFLMCEQIAPGERSTDNPGADNWLLYPPLAGKHLKVDKAVGEDRTLQVTVLRKEKIVLLFASAAIRDKVLFEFQECIDFANTVHAASKHPLPPLPTVNGVLKPHGDGIPSSQTAPDLHRPNVAPGSSSPSPHRVSSPIGSLNGSMSRRGSGPPSRNSHDTTATSPMSFTSSMSNLVSSLEAQIQQGGNWAPPAQDAHSGPMYPVRQPSQREAMDSGAVGQPPRIGGGFPPGPAHNFRGRSPPPIAPLPRLGISPGQIISPGQFIPPQRTASAEPLGRRGLPQGMDPSFGPRGPPRQPPIPVNGQFVPPSPPYVVPPGRTPSDPSFQGGIRKSPSAAPFNSPSEPGRALPPFDGALHPVMASSPNLQLPRTNSLGTMGEPQLRPVLPSVQFRAPSMVVGPPIDEPSPPTSPTMTRPAPTGPITSTVSAQMKCKVFLKQGHAQWKSLGSAKLKLYHQQPTNVKQLVVEAEDRNKSVLISTIVLSDGVERVGKTGVAVELSDNGARTGIVYMIQLRSEQSAVGLFESLLEGSDRKR